MIGYSTARREQTERIEAERLARAITLEVLDGVLTFARREQLAERLSDQETHLLASLAGPEKSPHTLRALATDLDYLAAWWRQHYASALPLPPDESQLDRFIAAQQGHENSPSPATLKRRLTSWAIFTRAVGGDAGILQSSARRNLPAGKNPVRQKNHSLDVAEFDRLIATCDLTDLTGCRDQALLMAAFALGLSPSQIATLTVADLIEGSRPAIRIPPRRPSAIKTVQQEPTSLPSTVYEALRVWLAQAHLTDGPLFRPVDRWQKPGRLGLTPQSVKLILRARASAAGLDPSALSARSLR